MLGVTGNRRQSPPNIGGALRTSSYDKNFVRDDQFCFRTKVEEEGQGQYDQFASLLPCDHQYSNLSRRLTPLQEIAEAREELMEMISDMPESSYELSLKDIVEEDYMYKEGDYKVVDDSSFRFETEAQIKKMKKKKKKKKMKRMESIRNSNKFSRSASMDSEIFLIKMFSIPSCFGSKKRNNINRINKNGSSKVSPRNSSEIGEDDHHKEPRIKTILSAGGNRSWGKIFSSSSSSSNSDSIISSIRLSGKHFSPCCWPFWQIKKSKARKLSGLL